MGKIDFGSAFSVGFSGYGKNVINLGVATLIAGVIGIVSLGICMPAMAAGLYVMSLKAVRGEGTEIGDIFKGFNGFGRYFLGALLAFALVIGGFVALCIGVFVVAGVLVFFYPMLVDRQEMGVGDALAHGDPVLPGYKPDQQRRKQHSRDRSVDHGADFDVHRCGGLRPGLQRHGRRSRRGSSGRDAD